MNFVVLIGRELPDAEIVDAPSASEAVRQALAGRYPEPVEAVAIAGARADIFRADRPSEWTIELLVTRLGSE